MDRCLSLRGQMSFKRSVPSLNALMVLEAAVRHRSFTAAARELNVSQAAVSRQIKLLEQELAAPLFHRSHQRVDPTPPGAALAATLHRAFEMIGEAVDMVRRPRDAETLTIGATLAFSHFWLMPRLSSFRDIRPDLKLRVVSQDEPFDLRTGGLDVLVRFGVPPFQDGEVAAQSRDTVVPVCAPCFAARFDRGSGLDGILALPLIGSDVPDPAWMFWPDWFERVGLGRRAPRLALQFNHYTDAIAAAVAGHGVALGWSLILRDLIAAGRLVALTEHVVAVEATYNAVLPKQRRSNPAAGAFVDWLRHEFEDRPMSAAATSGA